MTELIASVVSYFKNKASTTLFAIFGCFWITFHAEGFITLLFTKQEYIFEKYQMLKNEYLFRYFFGIHLDEPLWYARTLLPFLLTGLYVLLFARFVLNPVYKTELKYKNERRLIKYRSETLLQKEKDRLDRARIKSTKTQMALKAAQKAQDNIDPEKKWALEYKTLTSKPDGIKAINDLEDLYYKHSGEINDQFGKLRYSITSMSICESYGLFIRNEQYDSLIRITEKGWYFIRLKNNAGAKGAEVDLDNGI